MAAKGFEPIPKSLRGPFFPLKYTRGQDMRKVAWEADTYKNAVVQEADSRHLMNKGRNFLDSGDVRQTKAAPWSARRRPTHFIALRLPQECPIRSSIIALHNDVKESFTMSHWQDVFVPPSRLHLTLSVMTIDPVTEAEKLERAQQITARHIRDWRRLTQGNGFRLRSNTLGFFGDSRVAFAKLAADYDVQLLNKCVKDMRMEFSRAGIDIKGNPHDEFIPHVTIAKISEKLAKEKFNGAKSLPKSIFAHMQWDDLGLAQFHEVDFCCMKALGGNKSHADRNVKVLEEGGEENDGEQEEKKEASGSSSFEGLAEEESSVAVEEEDASVALPEKKSAEKKNEVPYYDTLMRASLLTRRK